MLLCSTHSYTCSGPTSCPVPLRPSPAVTTVTTVMLYCIGLLCLFLTTENDSKNKGIQNHLLHLLHLLAPICNSFSCTLTAIAIARPVAKQAVKLPTSCASAALIDFHAHGLLPAAARKQRSYVAPLTDHH